MTTPSKAVATSMLYQNQKWHFFKCKCVTAKKCPFLTTWTIVTRPTHMIFTQKVLPQVELIRSNFPDQKTFDQWLIISRKHPVTLRKKKLHPDLGHTDCMLASNTPINCKTHPSTPGNGASLVICESDFHIPWRTCVSRLWRTFSYNDCVLTKKYDAPVLDFDRPLWRTPSW